MYLPCIVIVLSMIIHLQYDDNTNLRSQNPRKMKTSRPSFDPCTPLWLFRWSWPNPGGPLNDFCRAWYKHFLTGEDLPRPRDFDRCNGDRRERRRPVGWRRSGKRRDLVRNRLRRIRRRQPRHSLSRPRSDQVAVCKEAESWGSRLSSRRILPETWASRWWHSRSWAWSYTDVISLIRAILCHCKQNFKI